MGWLLLIIAFVALMFFLSQSQSTTGLFESNLTVYYKAIASGLSISEAEDKMLSTRYPNEEEPTWSNNKGEVSKLSQKVGKIFEEENSLDGPVKSKVYAIFCNENGIPPTERMQQKYIDQLNEVNTKVKEKELPWVKLLPKTKSIFDVARNKFTINLGEELLKEINLNSTHLNDVLSSNQFMRLFKFWQIISTRDFIDTMGYIVSNNAVQYSDYLLRNLFYIYKEEEIALKKEAILDYNSYFKQYPTKWSSCLNPESEKTIIDKLSNDLSNIICGYLNENSFAQQVSLAIKDNMYAERSYRLSQIAYLFGDDKNAKQFDTTFGNELNY